ncbi:MAG: sulfatase-like hydrolase/transferase [Chloroflexi bacterium]|nr:sulfatase-like hydrolase/transferase [Chloroflexota bacterium]MBU1751585.1 sulfatase-like hydrolase/transferase [Chloroflexota bacterium]
MTPLRRAAAILIASTMFVLLTGAALGVWWLVRPASSPPRPNVVLLVLDAVRADHLSCYQYERPTTPHIDALAQEGVLLIECTAPAPWTVPSHGSLFTGMYPTSHGAHAEHLALSPLNITLAEVLRDVGYETGGFSANIYLSPTLGFDQGFTTYDVRLMDDVRPKPVRDAGEMNALVLPWLEARARDGRPFFLFVNYMDAHAPYLPPPPYDTRYDGPDDLVSRYDGAIAHLDSEVGRVLDKLEELGLSENTLVIVTADHGEFLGEHGLLDHKQHLFETVLRVPLVLWYPRSLPGGQRVAGLVQLTDVMPTILALAGVETPAAMQGRSLLPLIRGEQDPLAYNVAFAEYWRDELLIQKRGAVFDRRLRSLRVGDWKYIWSSAGAGELYNLRQDPGEMHNLALSEPAQTAAMRERLDRWVDLLVRLVPGNAPGGEQAQ